MPQLSSFPLALADKIAGALPALEKKPRWIDGIRDLPPTLAHNSVFLFNAAEHAEQPRLLNSDQQIISSTIGILIVVSKSPRPSNIETENINNLKESIRKTLQGWTPPAQKNQHFFPCRLVAGTPVSNALAAQDGKKLWLETVLCKHIATKNTPSTSTPSTSP